MNKLIAVASLFLVASCGGGGGSGSSSVGGGGGGTTNNAPAISNPGSLSVAEGETAITTISASDSNGDSLSFSLSGGDSDFFAISSNGVLRFRETPNYDAPGDADQNNVYTFSVTVSDGQASTSQDISVTVVNRITDFDQGIFQTAGVYQNSCGVPRSGRDPFDGSTYPDQQGSFADENNWLRSISNELYLWYDEINDVDPDNYANSTDQVLDYFDRMKTFAITPSGAPKDQYHFTYDSLEWKQLSQSGIAVGYGVQWVLLQSAAPRKIVVAFVESNSPASAAGLARGAEIITADGVDVMNGSDTETLNNAFFPADASQSHSFEVLDQGSSTPRSITMTPTEITKDPVQNVDVITTANGAVGYLTFNDHIATAEQELIDAVTFLKNSNVTDLVLDLRYNGGGYLDIANEMAFMIAGPNSTSGRTFSLQQFNDKHPSINPVTGQALNPRTFHDRAQGFSASQGIALPYLGLSKVYVLTTSNTCSASEAIINGLRGIDIEVIQIGSTTCGKPYGFYGLDNCGTTYFTVQFKGVNAKGYGDYSDGFSPSNLATVEGEPVPGCAVDDDFSKALGDPNEAMLSAALAYRANPGTCPALPSGMARRTPAPTSVVGFGSYQQPGRIIEPAFPGGLALP
jgi:C-terminal processing protease CtpA/Prc